LLSYLKAAGPGVILGSLAIGSGEWILFPAAVVNYGPYILWAALLSCVMQAVVAVESMKYAVYCGQPIHKAYQKLPPGPAAWALTWILAIVVPIIWPGWAIGSATALAALQLGRLPTPQDSQLVLTWGVVALTAGLVVLHLGKKIERTLELVSWPLLLLPLVTVAVGVAIAVPMAAWIEVLKGFGGFLKARLGFPSQDKIARGVVDALLETGVDEIDIAVDSPWFDPLRLAYELGRARSDRPQVRGEGVLR